MTRTTFGFLVLAAPLILSGCGGGDVGTEAPPVAVTPPPPITTPPVQTEADIAATPRRIDAQPLNAGEIAISWIDVSNDETGFLVERRTGGGAWTLVTTTAANATLYRDTTLAAGAAYEYRLTAQRPGGVAVPSAPVAAATPTATAPTIFFVDAARGDNANPGTESQPWQSIQKAANTLTAGQTVLVRAGTYSRNNFFAIVQVTQSGRDGAPITYKSFPGERPKLRSTVNVNYSGFDVKANYIVVDGFEFEGTVKELTLEQAQAERARRQAGGPVTPLTANSGIAFGSNGSGNPVFHHLVARNNIVRDHPLGGIGAIGADYVTIENNTVFNNGRYSYFGGSGISILTPRDFDTNNADYRIVIRNNISADNSNEIACECFGFRQPTDGNGIILDTYNSSNYTGRTLVVNNIVRNNGGRGIHVFQSRNVDVFYNTAYLNSTIAITGEGEITARNSSNVRVFNNILYALANRPANLAATSTNIVFDYNVVFGGTAFNATTGTNNLTNADPLFASVTGANAFFLNAGSPAADRSGGDVFQPTMDYYFARRPRGARNDAGAVEAR